MVEQKSILEHDGVGKPVLHEIEQPHGFLRARAGTRRLQVRPGVPGGIQRLCHQFSDIPHLIQACGAGYGTWVFHQATSQYSSC